MGRKGCQHGKMMTHTILPPPLDPHPDSKFINRFDSPPTTRLNTKVPFKPTNDSTFTEKCQKVQCPGCHSHPVSKSRDKANGAHKMKSCDVSLNQVDKGGYGRFSGISSTELLGHLSGQCWDECGEEYEDGDYQRDDGDVLVESEMSEKEISGAAATSSMTR